MFSMLSSMCVLGMLGAAQAPAPPAPAVPEVTMPGTQVLKVASKITGQDYVLHVALPRGYDDPTRRFPVIYVTDGQWDFTLVHAIYGQQYYDGFMPAAIIVGVTWGGEKPDYDTRRAFDLTPTPSGQPTRYGNGRKFLSFLKDEAIPLVESKYRTLPGERTLTGSSFAGLFTLYALFNEPATFNNYVLTSPVWQWDNGLMRRQAEQFAKTPLTRPVRVYVGIGEYEDVAGLETFVAGLKALQVDRLAIASAPVAGAGHAGAKTEGFTRGLQYAFARPCLTLDAKILERYVGDYEVGPMAKARVAVENGRLVAYAPGGNGKISLCAAGEKDFYVLGSFTKIHVEEKDGQVTGLRVANYGGETVATRAAKQ